MKTIFSKVVVITGGCGGIGSAFVSRFINDGAKVAVIDMNLSKAAEIKNSLKADETRLKFYQADVSSKEVCFQTVKIISEDFQKINHLINAVAFFGSKGLEANEKDWEKTMSVNVFSYSHMAQACFQEMKKISKVENCSILNLSSISAHQVQLDRWTYAASKGAINILTKSMALDMGREFGIRVNSVSPSWTWTPEVAKIDPQGRRQKVEEIASDFHLLRRVGETSEVAAAGAFLCSMDARFITGIF